ncbi:MAG: Gfo/Idh/MocA family oxidoreductase [Clostridia bacterium]|nr:Gfo/Idh/MocA family oxidoreductase [Clostridia bacterium]
MTARFALIGTGWRAGFFYRAAKLLPERFELTGVLCHSERGRAVAEEWHARVYENLDKIMADKPDFVVASVPGSAVADLARFFAAHDMPVMFETYCSESVEAMTALYREVGGARIQVAEQYPFQPMHAARISTARSGVLGRVYQARASFIQNYHAIAVLRRLLNIGMELPLVRAYKREDRRAAGPTRAGLPTEDRLENVAGEMFLLDYGDAAAIGDYESMQQRSWIRHPVVMVRGERGEILNDTVTYLKDILTPITYTLLRSQAGTDGNLEGDYLRGIQGNGEWIYRNPYLPARMLDDEIAVAACMDSMAAYARGGEAFYPLEQAFQDHYVCLLIKEAANTGRAVQAVKQLWQR